MNRLYKIVITQDPDDGRFIAEAPTLKPCVTWGDTVGEALEMINEAIEGVVEYLESKGLPVPDDSDKIFLQGKNQKIHTFLTVNIHESENLVTV